MRCLIISLIIIGLGACQNEKKAPEQLLVTVDNIAIRDAPGEKSRELRSLKAGEKLDDTGIVSDFVTPLELKDTLLQAPWIKVQTSDHLTGWVFAGAVRPLGAAPPDWFLQKQMRCFFGPGLTNRRNNWMAQGAHLESDADFANDYRNALALRDTLMQRLATRAEPNEAGFQPDFFWLKDAMPGFVFQMVAEGTQPYLFADYRNLQRKALNTKGEQDDRFVSICLLAFSVDSIESFFPSWTIQTSDYSGSSQLGNGQHRKMLSAIDAALQAGSMFKPELLTFKDLILNDILDKNSSYWQPVEKIKAELDQILAAFPACLSDRDRLALSERRKVFENPEENGIRVNLRAGE